MTRKRFPSASNFWHANAPRSRRRSQRCLRDRLPLGLFLNTSWLRIANRCHGESKPHAQKTGVPRADTSTAHTLTGVRVDEERGSWMPAAAYRRRTSQNPASNETRPIRPLRKSRPVLSCSS